MAPVQVSKRECREGIARTLELKIDKKGNVVNSLLTLREFGKDQETSPSLASFGQAHTLPDGSKRLEVALSDAAGADDTERPDPSVGEKDIGDDDADGEDPLGYVEADLGTHLARPLVEGEEIDGSEGIGGVDGARDEDKHPQPNVGEGRQARGRLEVGEGLSKSARSPGKQLGPRRTM